MWHNELYEAAQCACCGDKSHGWNLRVKMESIVSERSNSVFQGALNNPEIMWTITSDASWISVSFATPYERGVTGKIKRRMAFLYASTWLILVST